MVVGIDQVAYRLEMISLINVEYFYFRVSK